MMLKSLVALALLIAAASCQNNIDTSVPIVRTVSGLREFDYFSYSMVLHQRQANPNNRAASLDTSSIIVSAPMYNIPNAPTVNTGAVWDCPVRQGPCTPLRGDGDSDDRRLYDDMDANGNNENKTNQFLGGSMASNGDFFIICAHRYQTQVSGTFYPRGRCYYSDRDLSGFSSHTPCSLFGSTSNSGSGVCTAGTSAVVTTDGGSGVFGVGAPGSFLWRGSVTRLESQGNIFDRTPSSGQDAFGLLGYAMVTGRFSSINRLDYAVGNPRFSQSTYLGRVAIVMNSESLSITNQPLNGLQMGEYYGFSLLAANMAGDTFDELIVGAPMYRSSNQPETGRIFVYSNTNGALSLVRTIVGRDEFSRFGHAMANLGDINGDGFDDIAVSAPFGSGSGSVFIYYSSPTNTISPSPAQIITGEMVNMNRNTPNNLLSGFGTSLASGVDVDGNTYNDLAVGSFKSQEVYLLRTRPLAEVTVTMTPSVSVVNVQMDVNCALRGSMYACFSVETCLTYSGSGVSNSLDLTVTLFAERERLQNNLEQRIFFDNGMAGQFPSMLIVTRQATAGAQSCFDSMAYVQNGISDIFNGFVIEAEVTPPVLDPAPTDGNPLNPMDFGGFPIVSTLGTTNVQVETFKDCDGNTCTPNLMVSVTDLIFTGASNPTTFTVGAVSQINTQLTIMNTDDDAFSAILSFSYRTNQLQLERVYNNTVTGQLTLSCTSSTRDGLTTQTCNIGNPLNSNSALTVNVLFSPRPELVGDEEQVTVEYVVDSLNDEESGNEDDNSATQTLPINARADIFLDSPGIVFPESVSYSDTAPEGAIENVTQLGPSVRTTFVVRNSGPSTVPTVELTVMWPLEGSETGLHTFLYPASISAMSSATVVCSMTNINPLNYALPEEEDEAGEGGQGVVPGGRRRRRRRSVPELGRRVKRQTVDSNPEPTTTTEDIARSCADSGQILNCQSITCNILGLVGGSSAQVEILAYADERFFSSSNDRFTLTPTASVRIVDADYIMSGVFPNSSANILVIPAGSINPITVVPPFPWYAVVFPILAVIVIIAAIAIGLYYCGFFRRAKHEEIKQKREELANLTDNGVTPGGEDGTKL